MHKESPFAKPACYHKKPATANPEKWVSDGGSTENFVETPCAVNSWFFPNACAEDVYAKSTGVRFVRSRRVQSCFQKILKPPVGFRGCLLRSKRQNVGEKLTEIFPFLKNGWTENFRSKEIWNEHPVLIQNMPFTLQDTPFKKLAKNEEKRPTKFNGPKG